MTGEDLLQRRTRMGLTQQQLGDLLDVPKNTIWRWETGATAIRHPTILDLALTTIEDRQPDSQDSVERRKRAHALLSGMLGSPIGDPKSTCRDGDIPTRATIVKGD